VKGQKLFVRPVSPADYDEIADFYAEQTSPFPADSPSLVGKLVGRIVAHLSYRTVGDIVVIDHLFVARDLRRRRVGRFMISELERLAGTEANLLRARQVDSATDFLMAIGFRPAGDGGLERPISRQEDS
jgi:GNAT superfamily N-acetyltransferase